MRPVRSSTDMFAILRELDRSVKSTNMRGSFGTEPLSVVFIGTAAAGKVKRYRAVWFVTVISVLIEVFKANAKYPGSALTEFLILFDARRVLAK